MLVAWVVLGGAALLFLLVVFRGAPYVPSRARDIEGAFEHLYPLGPSDLVVDVGSGDGIVLRAAARRGAQALGYELNPLLVLVSRWLSRHQPRVRVKLADAWITDLPADTTLVYVFSTSRDIEKLGRWVDKQSDQLGRTLYLMSYGIKLDRTEYRAQGPYYLYRITPLHQEKDTV